MVIFNWPKPQEGQNGHNVVQVTGTEKNSHHVHIAVLGLRFTVFDQIGDRYCHLFSS